jgi:hypothetical protein
MGADCDPSGRLRALPANGCSRRYGYWVKGLASMRLGKISVDFLLSGSASLFQGRFTKLCFCRCATVAK